MAANVAARRYRACYTMLLRLYPRPFHERFADGMVQTFKAESESPASVLCSMG